MLMSSINQTLFFSGLHELGARDWPGLPEFVAIDGKTSRRGPLRRVSAFAMTNGLVLGPEIIESKTNELSAIHADQTSGCKRQMKGTLISIDANAAIATGIADAFAEDRSRLRKDHGAKTMAVVRHFAINLTWHAPRFVRAPKPN